MLQIYFNAPIRVIAEWIDSHGLASALSKRDQSVLSKANDKLTNQERVDLYWYIEAL